MNCPNCGAILSRTRGSLYRCDGCGSNWRSRKNGTLLVGYVMNIKSRKDFLAVAKSMGFSLPKEAKSFDLLVFADNCDEKGLTALAQLARSIWREGW